MAAEPTVWTPRAVGHIGRSTGEIPECDRFKYPFCISLETSPERSKMLSIVKAIRSLGFKTRHWSFWERGCLVRICKIATDAPVKVIRGLLEDYCTEVFVDLSEPRIWKRPKKSIKGSCRFRRFSVTLKLEEWKTVPSGHWGRTEAGAVFIGCPECDRSFRLPNAISSEGLVKYGIGCPHSRSEYPYFGCSAQLKAVTLLDWTFGNLEAS